jgi:hypothetical protein
MSRREIGGQGEFVDFKRLRQGDLVAEGVWVGTRKGKFGPIFEIYNEDTEESVIVPGSGQLKYKMQEFVKLGQFVEIEYDGTEKMREGTYRGSDVHCFRVFVDDDYVPRTGVGKAAIGKDNDDSVFEKNRDDDEPRRDSRREEPRRDSRRDDRDPPPRRESRRDDRDPPPRREARRDDRDDRDPPPRRDSRRDDRDPNPARARKPAPADDFDDDEDLM